MRETVAGGAPFRKLFSKEQRAFYAEHAPEAVALDDLTILGPIFVLKLKFSPAGSTSARWSPRCGCTRTTRACSSSRRSARRRRRSGVAAEAREFLHTRGVDLTGEQETKTRKALDFFSGQLSEAEGEGSLAVALERCREHEEAADAEPEQGGMPSVSVTGASKNNVSSAPTPNSAAATGSSFDRTARGAPGHVRRTSRASASNRPRSSRP